MRALLRSHMCIATLFGLVACGPKAPTSGLSAGDVTTIRSIRSVEAEPGTVAWDDAIRHMLVVRFDRDSSGMLDTSDELAKVPCEVWSVLNDELVENSGFDGLRTSYGFQPDLIFLGENLGISMRLGTDAQSRLDRCGISA